MISAARVQRRYARALRDTITIERATKSGGTISWSIPATARAQVRGYRPQEIGGTIQQGDQECIVLKSDLDSEGFPVPPRKDDRVTKSDGLTATVQSCDANTRSVFGATVAYVLQLRGK